MKRLPSGRSISITSPAPKFSIATTRPSASPSVGHRGQADQVGMIIFALASGGSAERGTVSSVPRSASAALRSATSAKRAIAPLLPSGAAT